MQPPSSDPESPPPTSPATAGPDPEAGPTSGETEPGAPDDQLVGVEADLDAVASALDALDADDLTQAESLVESLGDAAADDDGSTAGAAD